MALKSRVQSLDHALTVTDCEHSTAEIRAFVANSPTGPRYTFLGAGISKQAYLLDCGKHVIKVGRSGDDQTIAEYRTWNDAPAALKRILAPVRAFGVIESQPVIITDRATTVDTNRSGWRLPRKYRRMAETASRYGIRDIHSGNVGVIAGRCVMIDYGIGRINSSGDGTGYMASSEFSTDSSSETTSVSPDSLPRCGDCGTEDFTCCLADHVCQQPTPVSKNRCGQCSASFHFLSNLEAHQRVCHP